MGYGKKTTVSLITFTSCFLFSLSSGYGKYALSGVVGGSFSSPSSVPIHYLIRGYYKWDEQVLLGVSSGQQNGGIPILSSAHIRLPIGNVLQPVLTGDLGLSMYNSSVSNLRFTWKAGVGMDWKNGQYSSLLVLLGRERIGSHRSVYAQLGLLLEY